MMDVIGVDLETTGLEESTCYITEIGAILFNGITWEPKAAFQTFIHEPLAIPLSDEIKALTHISDSDIKSGRTPFEALALFESFAKGTRAFIAHNKEFEKKFFAHSFKRYNYTPEHDMLSKPWVCSKTDIDHGNKTCTKLSHLALDYGCKVDGAKLHRAIEDVEVMGRMLAKIGKPIQEIIDYAKEPWVYLQAQVSFNDKELARKDGYLWEKIYGDYNSPVFPKSWVKRIKESKLEAERSKDVGFKRVVLVPPEKK